MALQAWAKGPSVSVAGGSIYVTDEPTWEDVMPGVGEEQVPDVQVTFEPEMVRVSGLPALFRQPASVHLDPSLATTANEVCWNVPIESPADLERAVELAKEFREIDEDLQDDALEALSRAYSLGEVEATLSEWRGLTCNRCGKRNAPDVWQGDGVSICGPCRDDAAAYGEHWSSTNGCHPACPACARGE